MKVRRKKSQSDGSQRKSEHRLRLRKKSGAANGANLFGFLDRFRSFTAFAFAVCGRDYSRSFESLILSCYMQAAEEPSARLRVSSEVSYFHACLSFFVIKVFLSFSHFYVDGTI